jgi:hypothetical protein
MYKKVQAKLDPSTVCDLKALNNQKLLGENLYFQTSPIVRAKEGYQLQMSEKFIYNFLFSKIHFQLNDFSHTIFLT